jgi:hypothetical protein
MERRQAHTFGKEDAIQYMHYLVYTLDVDVSAHTEEQFSDDGVNQKACWARSARILTTRLSNKDSEHCTSLSRYFVN